MAGALGERALEGVEEQLALPVAADERRIEPARPARRVGAYAEQAVHDDRLGLALERERLDRLDVHGVADQLVGRVPEQDLAGAGRLLEAGRDVDGVARREPLARARSPAITSPVLTPVRTAIFTPRSATRSTLRRASASRISTAARTARSASSSCTTGMPKTAMTASPTNFSTVPPCRSTTARISSK